MRKAQRINHEQLDLDSALMKVISLMLKTGKKIRNTCNIYEIHIFMSIIIGNKYRAEMESGMGKLI